MTSVSIPRRDGMSFFTRHGDRDAMEQNARLRFRHSGKPRSIENAAVEVRPPLDAHGMKQERHRTRGADRRRDISAVDHARRPPKHVEDRESDRNATAVERADGQKRFDTLPKETAPKKARSEPGIPEVGPLEALELAREPLGIDPRRPRRADESACARARNTGRKQPRFLECREESRVRVEGEEA